MEEVENDGKFSGTWECHHCRSTTCCSRHPGVPGPSGLLWGGLFGRVPPISSWAGSGPPWLADHVRLTGIDSLPGACLPSPIWLENSEEWRPLRSKLFWKFPFPLSLRLIQILECYFGKDFGDMRLDFLSPNLKLGVEAPRGVVVCFLQHNNRLLPRPPITLCFPIPSFDPGRTLPPNAFF